MTEISARAAEVGAQYLPEWANDGLYFAVLRGDADAVSRQGVANAMVADLGIALPNSAAYPSFPGRDEVARALSLSEPPTVALHAAAVMLDNRDRLLAKVGNWAASAVKGVFVGAAVLSEAVHQMSGSVARAGGRASDFAAGAGLTVDALSGVSLRAIRREVDRLVERRYGERLTLDDDMRKAAVWGILLRRLADSQHTPDDVLVRVALRYLESYKRSGLADGQNKMAFAHQYAYGYAVSAGLGGSLPKVIAALDRVQSAEGAILGERAQHALSIVADHARRAVQPKGSILPVDTDSL